MLSLKLFAFSGGSLDMNALEDVKNFQQASGASSVMVARAAMWNCSVFRKEGKLPYDTVLREYLRYVSVVGPRFEILFFPSFLDF